MLKHIEIINDSGKTLRGYLNSPENANDELVIMYHGFTGNKTEHGGLFRDFSRVLEQNKINSLRMDYSGNGESDGSFKDFTFDTLMSDSEAILDYGKQIYGINKISLLGYSMGGAVAAYIASKRNGEIDKLLLWSPSGNMENKIKDIYEKCPKLENGNADLPNFELSKLMYESVAKYKSYDNLERFTKNVYIIHGRQDKAVNYLDGVRYSVSFINAHIDIIDTAGHGYDKREEKERLFYKSLEFLKG